jgi:hypothetical protein
LDARGIEPATGRRAFYTFRHDTRHFVTGVTSDGRQMLTAGLTALFFDADGNFICVQERPTPAAALPPNDSWPRLDPARDAAFADAVRRWHAELQLVPSPIRVRRFAVPVGDVEIGIADHPAEQMDVADLERPVDEREFVFYWGTEFWMSGAGEVLAT